jgi:hypothetical protein
MVRGDVYLTMEVGASRSQPQPGGNPGPTNTGAHRKPCPHSPCHTNTFLTIHLLSVSPSRRTQGTPTAPCLPGLTQHRWPTLSMSTCAPSLPLKTSYCPEQIRPKKCPAQWPLRATAQSSGARCIGEFAVGPPPWLGVLVHLCGLSTHTRRPGGE